MISADIRAQIKAGETPATAFIASPDDVAAISATVCGFLNSRGGVVFVGVDPTRGVVGVGPEAESARRRLETQLQNDISPKALFTLSIDTDQDQAIISIEAPEGRDVPYVVDGRVFVRRGARTVVADPELLRQLVQSRSIEADRWERRPSLGLNETDLSGAEVRTTVEEARVSDRFVFSDGEDIRSVVRQLGLVASNGLTNGCDVLFAERPAVRHPQCRVRFIQYETDKTASTYIDSQWFEGPLVRVFSQLIEKVGAQVRVQALFVAGEHGRKDQPNYSQDALREGLVNALAHRDYAGFSGGLTVSVYPNRIEIWNAGRLPKGLKVGDLKKPHPSIPTNPDIAHVLYIRGLMERVGRGTQKIIAACDALGARPPRWKDDATGVTLTIYSATTEAGEFSPSPRQAQLLEKLRPGDSIRLADYIQMQPVSERQARRDLAELEDAGYLVRSGAARSTTYRRSERTL
ncbi:MAG: ATP-binding protein [Pseudomonadota bacterium]|nr:ATP-binding protein [Pseudomonadota bacterium]